jgi:hypothetical protein
VLPIERILDQARASVAGAVTEPELEHEHGKLIYEVEIVNSDGRKVGIEYDARTGAELTREVKSRKSKREDQPEYRGLGVRPAIFSVRAAIVLSRERLYRLSGEEMSST